MSYAFENIALSADEEYAIKRYEKSFKDPWVIWALRQKRAAKYVETHLVAIKDKSQYGSPYNCYHTGYEVYERRDGQPITQDDYDAVRALNKGQENKVIGEVGDRTISHQWVCDSSG